MNIQYFQEFITLAETRNFWEASERLYMNQSTLSKHIHALEEELGCSLFIRTTRHVELTEYGRVLLPYAKDISRSFFDCSTALKKISDQSKGLLTIGSIPDMDSYGITNVLLSYQNLHPEHTIRIIEEDPNNLRELLFSHKCDLIFQRETKLDFEKNFTVDTRITRIPYVKDHMIVAVSRHHPLAQKKSVSLKELQNENFCLLKENSLMYEMCVSACQASGFLPNIVFTSQRLGNLLDMVSRQRGVALLMNLHTIIPTDDPGVVSSLGYAAIDITPKITSQISLCYSNDLPLTSAAASFVNYCQEAFLSKSFLSKFGTGDTAADETAAPANPS
jgi:DNA-binding transcriptional LysR family regulator